MAHADSSGHSILRGLLDEISWEGRSVRAYRDGDEGARTC